MSAPSQSRPSSSSPPPPAPRPGQSSSSSSSSSTTSSSSSSSSTSSSSQNRDGSTTRLSRPSTISQSQKDQDKKNLPTNCLQRLRTDVYKLMMSDYNVVVADGSNLRELFVLFHGPAETPYAAGTWKVHVELPENYPYKSPSIGFCNKIYHPNIEERSGSVCLDVINQAWQPMFDLVNVFESFLPQLLRYPNANDPLNAEAATLMMRDIRAYDNKIKNFVRLYATDIELGDADREIRTKKKTTELINAVNASSCARALGEHTITVSTAQTSSCESSSTSSAHSPSGNDRDPSSRSLSPPEHCRYRRPRSSRDDGDHSGTESLASSGSLGSVEPASDSDDGK